MPNHVITILTASPAVIASLAGPTGNVDFTSVITPPDSDLYRSDSCSHDHGELSGEPDPAPDCWHSWNSRTWGTKWNAYSVSEVTGAPGDHAVVSFDTAWSHPFPIIAALSARFPDEPIHVKFASEDVGSHFGEYAVLDGHYAPNEDLPAEGTDEGRDWACRIRYGASYAELMAE